MEQCSNGTTVHNVFTIVCAKSFDGLLLGINDANIKPANHSDIQAHEMIVVRVM